MSKIIQLRSKSGKSYGFVDKLIGAGGMKDVYFSPDKSYVIALFRDKQDGNSRSRLENIIGPYREKIFAGNEVGYWAERYCWPTDIVEHDGKLGVVVPTYRKNFFFDFGSKNNDMNKLLGKEKEGKWFASANLRQNVLDPRELADWRKHLLVCLNISRAVRRMHAAGLAHSDLSYKNVLIDPCTGGACIIDIDGLVVPGKFPPDVVGTPDFIAPEVVSSLHLKSTDPNRKLPKRETDLHALSVLIYMYLLYRHPLRGKKVHDIDDDHKDESLRMGSQALFVENPMDKSNRISSDDLRKSEQIWDPSKKPYEILGPYLKELVEQAFVKGLHHPNLRPTANDWEYALVKTVDLIQPCSNSACEQKWYVFDNSTKPTCPFCLSKFKGLLPVLNLYSFRKDKFSSDNHRIMVYPNQYIHEWHVNRAIFPNEKLTEEQRKPVGYFQFHQGKWLFINQKINGLIDKSENNKAIPIGDSVELKDNQQLILSKDEGGRLFHIQMVSV
jgi:serine/threonine protein kinase